ncbi:MAG: collagen-binding domain-containing protein [Verrucomicrobiota bacterium]
MLFLSASAVFGQLDIGDYGIIVRDDASIGGAHVHPGMIVGGNLTASQPIDFGRDLVSAAPALIVEGNVDTGNQIGLFNKSYYFHNPADRGAGSNLQNPGTALTNDPLEGDFSAIFAGFQERSTSFLTTPGTPTFAQEGKQLSLTAISGITNYFTFTAASLAPFFGDSNRQVQYNNVSNGDTRIVVNYIGNGGALTFNAQTMGLDATTYDQVLWNFSNVSTLTISSAATSFHGSILAPNSQVIWNATDLDGQLIAESLQWNGGSRQIHDYAYFTGPLEPIPEPSTIGLGAVAALGALMLSRTLHQRRSAQA